MNGILESMMARPRGFIPETVTQYTALQLAKKLDDAGRISRYLPLFDSHPLSLILQAYASAQETGLTGKRLVTAFDELLAALTTNEDDYEL